jgi:hypothetical protein
MTRRDPIVDEVRRHRAAIAREHGNDLDAIIAAFQREDARDNRPAVSLAPKRIGRQQRSRSTATRRPNRRLHPTASRQGR